jgi:hypothetical protein
MSQIGPWLAVAGLGALHGLNPATGWLLAAAWGVRSHDRTRARRAWMPIALGHLASVALVAAAVASMPALGDVLLPALQAVAVLLLLAVVLAHVRGRRQGASRRAAASAGTAGLGLWSFVMSTAHGSGLMLVPALVPLCLSDTPAREITASGSIVLALAAVGVHMATMLAVTAALASGACGAAQWWRRHRRCAPP